jgi:hypothetical protein
MIPVTFTKDSSDCISYYDNNKDIRKLIHEADVRDQIAEEFKKIAGNIDLNTVSNNTLGYLIQEVNKKKFCSRISNIVIHPPGTKFKHR